MTNTTDPSYWLNWRFILCALWVLADMIFASFLIWKYEGHSRANVVSEHQRVSAGVLYKDEAWRTCLKGIHPAWLLAFRMFAFVLLLSLIIGNTIADGGGIFVYYTQWTFTLVTIYFGFASVFSIYGCLQCRDKIGYNADRRTLDEHGIYVAPCLGETENAPVIWKSSYNHERHRVLHTAGLFGYLLQIMYQMSAGAVVLTDVVFWLVIFPFLTSVDFKLTFYVVSMHSVNAVLLIDTFLNCMRFPMFRFGYFIFWTSTYIIFQWIIHACINLWWPYPFLDLSSSFAPLWYLGVGLLHIPCYGFFALIVTIKHFWLSRSFPETYRGTR
ncbi:hypothetical protein Nepgr_032971 [Nepenthes gracilis]|uniref:Transmembrane protein n=1 Tax=Nepenthes gracilis TaxID=150966 RepID=A0AAD3TJP4_NEPGR|nr:hypothetical protein Nepgr_032971 [Nepenthes gracilis]